MALTDTKLKQAKGQAESYKLADEKGLYLLVTIGGSKLWRMDYRFDAKRKTMALGAYPEVSLRDARDRRDAARKQLANKEDPGDVRKQGKKNRRIAIANTFAAIADEWYAKQLASWAPSTAAKKRSLLENDLVPYLGPRPVADLETIDLLGCLQRIEQRGKIETAHKARQVLNQIFRFAKQTQRIKQNPAIDLVGAIAPKRAKHHAAITDPMEYGRLLLAIDKYTGTPVVRTLLALSPLLFQRPGEMRAMEWSELDLDNGVWALPAEKMKMANSHIVPLSKQAIALLLDIKPLTGSGRYVFPSQRRDGKYASENTVNKALRTLGYDTGTQHCAHGFRASARTLLDEQLNIRVEWIEHQLAHRVKDALGRAYNRTTHIEDRKRMMQTLADYLDTLRAAARGENIIPFSRMRAAE